MNEIINRVTIMIQDAMTFILACILVVLYASFLLLRVLITGKTNSESNKEAENFYG